ncbi:hypothetical protein [Kordia sp.]|uniref:hypothetical protein n=1 Tax=Kordia sp. TaxID=1965332 RepID=UPI003D2873A4
MCKASETIRFCSCADNLENASKHSKSIYYVWTIERILGINDFAMDGLLMEDPKQLDELVAETILRKLNSKNLFDFDYKPQDNDSLEIKRVNPKKRYQKKKCIGTHLNFYYLFNKWHIGYADVFTYQLESYKNGKVEILKINNSK